MQKRDLWYGYRWTMCDTWTLRGYYYRQVGYEAAYAPVLACKANWGCVDALARWEGGSAVQERCPPVHPAVRGVEMPGRAAIR